MGDGLALPYWASLPTEGQESSYAQKIQRPLALLPEHLTGLHESSAEGKTKDKKRVICWLLLKHKGVFSYNENDLGQTNLVEYTIYTGEARPIRQQPLHLPMTFVDKEHRS